MFNEIVFHGTNKERGQRILESNKMEETIGDRHWLGNGSYFFIEDIYAYKWIADMCNERYGSKNDDEKLLECYMILQSNLLTSKDRVFDLAKAVHKIEFDKVYLCIKRHKKYSKKLAKHKLAEGVVLNYMFNELDYQEDYDLVRALFCLNNSKYNKTNIKNGYMPQEQICVKNQDIVKDIKVYEFNKNISGYKELIKSLYFYEQQEYQKVYNKKKQKNYRI